MVHVSINWCSFHLHFFFFFFTFPKISWHCKDKNAQRQSSCYKNQSFWWLTTWINEWVTYTGKWLLRKKGKRTFISINSIHEEGNGISESRNITKMHFLQLKYIPCICNNAIAIYTLNGFTDCVTPITELWRLNWQQIWWFSSFNLCSTPLLKIKKWHSLCMSQWEVLICYFTNCNQLTIVAFLHL